MNSKRNKIILVRIPCDVDNEDLRIVFESNAFGYQTVVNLIEKIHSNNKGLKDVIIEFEDDEAAREVAKKRSFEFEFDQHTILLRPVLYLENLDNTKQNDSPQAEAVAKSFKEELQEQLYTCWIGNIPELPEKKLEEFFDQEIRKLINKFHSIKLTFTQKHKKYQCFINFFNQEDAEKVVGYFEGSKMGKSVLEAKIRYSQKSISESNSNSDSDSDSDESEIGPEDSSKHTDSSLVANAKLHEKIYRINNSKSFNGLIEKQIEIIKLKYNQDVNINVFTKNSRRKKSKNIQISSENVAKMNECFNELKSKIKINHKKIRFSKNEFDQVIKLKAELIKIIPNKNKELFFIDFNEKKRSIIIEFFDSGDKQIRREYFKFLNRIQKFCDERIESEKEFFISDSDHLNYLKMRLSKQNGFKFNFILVDGTKFKLVLNGKKLNLDKFDVADLLKQIKIVNAECKINNKSLISHMNHKLKLFKSELESSDLLLIYNKIENDSNSFSIKIVSTNSQEAKKKIDDIKRYFSNVKCFVVDFDDAKLGKRLEREIKALHKNDCDVAYREDKKKFFINAIDSNIINAVKLQIQNNKTH